jgi:hypothetical protein
MRGTDQQQGHMFSYLLPEERVRKDHPLRTIRGIVDGVVQQLSRRFDAMHARVGRLSREASQRACARGLDGDCERVPAWWGLVRHWSTRLADWRSLTAKDCAAETCAT